MQASSRPVWPIALLVCLSAAGLAAAQQTVQVFPGDTLCPPGQRLVSVSAALSKTSKICNRLADFEVARLSGRGSISGPALNCQISHDDERPLQRSLCTARQDYSRIRGVLLSGHFRTQEALNRMSQDDWRAALVTELANRTAGLSQDYHHLTHAELAGAGGILVYLLRIRQMAPEKIARLTLAQLRQVFIDDLIIQTGQSQTVLQSLDDLELLQILYRG